MGICLSDCYKVFKILIHTKASGQGPIGPGEPSMVSLTDENEVTVHKQKCLVDLRCYIIVASDDDCCTCV